MKTDKPFISFVVTTFNKGKYITKVLEALLNQDYPKSKLEILVVDDNSTDDTQEKIKKLQKKFKNIKLFIKPPRSKKGPAGSSNFGIQKAKGKFIASVDGDAIIPNTWLKEVLSEFSDKRIGIVSGLIDTANPQNIWATFVGRELEDRFLMMKGKEVESISPCNTLYKREIFDQVGLFNEEFNYYAQDVEFCYRVRQAGYKILVTKKTGCRHYWRESFWGWLQQIYGTGYGRLEVVARFPEKHKGDQVSGWKLISQVPMSLLFLFLLGVNFLFRVPILLVFTLSLAIILILIQFPITFRIIRRTKDLRFLLFPGILFLRNLTWAWAFVRYTAKQARGLF